MSPVHQASNNQEAFLALLTGTQNRKHELLTSRPCGSSFIWQSRIRAQKPSPDASCIRATGLRLPASVTHSQSKPRTRESAHFLKSVYLIRDSVHCSCGLLHTQVLFILYCKDKFFILTLLQTSVLRTTWNMPYCFQSNISFWFKCYIFCLYCSILFGKNYVTR
jgi:hypothetical protein